MNNKNKALTKTVRGNHPPPGNRPFRKTFPKKFKGDCRICGKKGHKAADCWDNEKNKDKRPNFAKAMVTQDSPAKSNLHCTYCGRDNHTVDRCFKKQKDEKKNNLNKKDAADIVMISIDKQVTLYHKHDHPYDKFSSKTLNENTFVVDSGATSHMRFSTDGMYDLQEWRSEVTVGNNQVMHSVAKGTYKGIVVQKNGDTIAITLEDVLYVPDLWVNLFSLTRAISKPNVYLGNIGNLITLNVNAEEIIFDKVLPSGNGRLLAVDILPHTS
jgi:hypothetical protein